MKIERKLKIGENEYTVTVDADNATDFIKTMSFFDSIPKVGPNGETDLVLSYRTPKNYEYYSIVSQKAGMEFKFGQHKDRPGSLFGKGWEPLFKGEEDGDDASHTTAPTGGLGAPVNVPAPAAQSVGLGGAKAAAPAAAKTVQQQREAPSTQVQNQATAILSKFGI